jgi:predicted metalloprotease
LAHCRGNFRLNSHTRLRLDFFRPIRIIARGFQGDIMRWQGGRESANVEDRRGIPGGPVTIGGGLGMLVLVVIVMLLGGNPQMLLQNIPNAPPAQNGDPGDGIHDQAREFVSVVLADTEDVWHELFRQMGRQYDEPRLVLFRGHDRSGCGFADAATGPFYCPDDQTVYIDLTFYRELRDRFGAPGDFAQAYVIAHEVGHHVQNQLGVLSRVHAQQRRRGDPEAHELSVRLELQADFYAGVWAHHAQKMKNILEPGDLEEALRAASAIGDDRLQQETQGYAVPDSFTHGTSEQRVRWFRRGFETGRLEEGDTFSVDYGSL